MKRTLLYSSSLALAALAGACAQDATTPVAPESALMANKPGTTSAVSLTVTIASTCPTTDPYAPCRIKGDDQGAYTDGVQNVKAVLDQYGNFIFDTNNSRSSAIRFIKHDFSARHADTLGTADGAPKPDTTRGFYFSMVKSQLSTGKVHLQSMPYGADAGGHDKQCVAFSSGYSLPNSKLTARLSFHRGHEDNEKSPTAYGVVHRVDVNTWTIKPGKGWDCPNVDAANRAQTDDVAAVRNDDGSALYGYYHLPFIFTLKRK